MCGTRQPTEKAVAEARNSPDGWVYEIDGSFGPDEDVPPDAIVGAWKVDSNGQIVGKFVPNPNYRPRQRNKQKYGSQF